MIVHVAQERVTILNSEYWLLNTALAKPTKEVLASASSKRTTKIATKVGGNQPQMNTVPRFWAAPKIVANNTFRVVESPGLGGQSLR